MAAVALSRPAPQQFTALRLPQQQALPHARRHSSTCSAAADGTGAAAAPAGPPPHAPDAEGGVLQQRPQVVTPQWQAAIDLLQSGEVFTTKVLAVNKSGVKVAVGKLQGFVPYKLMDRARLQGTEKDTWTRDLVGQEMRVKVTQVVVPERRLICSEKAAMLDTVAMTAAPGEVLSGRVVSLHEFGAFVEVATPPYTGAEVILPVREVSWDWIGSVNAKLARDDELRVVVIEVRPPPKSRVVVSLKRLQADPLQETLDRVLPLEGGNGYADVGSVPASVPAAVEDILDELSREPGVTGVTLGRRVEEQRTVSQDLELWMTREEVTDGFNLVARAGRVVQEIHVTTGMPAREMKAAVQRVLQRVG